MGLVAISFIFIMLCLFLYEIVKDCLVQSEINRIRENQFWNELYSKIPPEYGISRSEYEQFAVICENMAELD